MKRPVLALGILGALFSGQAQAEPQFKEQVREVLHVVRETMQERRQRIALCEAMDAFADELARSGAPRKKVRWLRLQIDRKRHPEAFES